MITTKQQDIFLRDDRERKGAFYTPQIWVEKSQEYLAKTFGENWQDEYYIWDCAAGTGNLLVGLTNKNNVWASTLDEPDVSTMLDYTGHGLNLDKTHIFQFDFLNDEFLPQSKGGKLPDSLYKVICDPKKRTKLIIYINPPYAEHGNKRVMASGGRDEHKASVSFSKTKDKYRHLLGSGGREICTQFFIRVSQELPHAHLATFCKLGHITNTNYRLFRKHFNVAFQKGFVVPADTFDNVTGHFPIGFFVWNFDKESCLKHVTCDVFDKHLQRMGTKTFYTYDGYEMITRWERRLCSDNSEIIGVFHLGRHDFQNTKLVFIETTWTCDNFVGNITVKNFVPLSICLAVQHCIDHTWLNDRDQFLSPNDQWKQDKEFQMNCLIYTLFHPQNRIKSSEDINHWIPFTATEVGAKQEFKSTFMSDYLKKHRITCNAAKEVLQAGKALWTYYHQKIRENNYWLTDASLYEIREYFRGRNEKERLKTKSADDLSNALDADLCSALKFLAAKIQPKVYEYGFLKK